MRQLKLTSLAAFSAALFSQSVTAAVYNVTEIDTYRSVVSAIPIALNEAGAVAVTGEFPYNPKIDLELIDFEAEFWQDNLTDIDSAQNGNFNADDLSFIVNYLRSQEASKLVQRVAVDASYLWENTTLNQIHGLDQVDATFGDFSGSTDTFVNNINDSGVTVGRSEGVFSKLEYTNEEGTELTYVVQEYSTRAFVDLNGTVVGLVSESDLGGGFSEAMDITNGLLVAGYEVIEPTDVLQELINESCTDDEIRGDQPVEVCIQTQLDAGINFSHQIRGVMWQLDQSGNVIDKQQFGLPFTVAEDDTSLYNSTINAVNENAIGVGYATNFFDDNESIPRIYAAIFEGETVTSITDRSEYIDSLASDINEQNIAVGYASKQINGFTRTKFFIHDVTSDVTTFPDDYFPGSSSVARAINNDGMVVGEGEVDSDLTNTRRRNAFIYDINNDSFQNLNDLIACNSPYNLVQAYDINDAGQIIATALIERNTLDIKAEEIVNDDGTNEASEMIVSVILDPIAGGEIESCDPPAEEVQERNSGSMGWGLFAIAALFGLRRRMR
ncbi:MAG: DUF3466 family protein [Alteromonadaceae bacterium]|nr:DUF3466 family protein [Alteromonadaceae bacterium]